MTANLNVDAPLDAETFRSWVRADLAHNVLARVWEALDEIGDSLGPVTARSSGVRTKALKAPAITTVPRNARALYQEVLQVAADGARILESKSNGGQ